jgi:hypothetical protein
MSQDNKESVLSRWSRRKLEADQLAPTVEESVQLDTEAGLITVDQAAADAETKPILTDADMPDIESLDEDSDFSGFMSAGVSDKLRNLALRKLFKAPVFNIRDGLDEYDEDYTYFEKLGDIVTCDMKHQIEMQEMRRREEQESEAEEHDEIAEIEDNEEIEDDMEAKEANQDDGLDPELDEQTELVAQAELKSKPKQEPENEQ